MSDTDDGNGGVYLPLETAVPLAQFLAGCPVLDMGERRAIAGEAAAALEHAYVHLPAKQMLYSVDPVGRLRALAARLDAGAEPADPVADPATDLAFHRDMATILNECRDVHTGYYLPRPFDRAVAFLPFQIEECFVGGARRYLVPRVFGADPAVAADADFARGVEIVAWGGEPIDSVVTREADATPGINLWARHARGLYRLTTRFLARCPPPEAEWVRVTYLGADGGRRDITLGWRVVALPPDLSSLPEGSPIGERPHKTLDFETEAFHALKRKLSAEHRDDILPAALQQTLLEREAPANFEGYCRSAANGAAYGYVRIRSFVTDDARRSLAGFAGLAAGLPARGLVLDVRDNPGGSIRLAEMILQALAGRRLSRAGLVFRGTAFAELLCTEVPHAFGRWSEVVRQARAAGATYSAGVPLWPDADYEDIAAAYAGPVVLIVNALSYSATDFFAAGFADHALGPILGVQGSTGGGGANVMTVAGLASEIAPVRDRFADTWTPTALPKGADIHVAFRRSVRAGRNAGLALEDLGVTPDVPIHYPTRDDVMRGNRDLFDRAVALLSTSGVGERPR